LKSQKVYFGLLGFYLFYKGKWFFFILFIFIGVIIPLSFIIPRTMFRLSLLYPDSNKGHKRGGLRKAGQKGYFCRIKIF
jgi:hypothetical protein